MLDTQITITVIGLLIGLILALTGAGGSIVALPILILALNLSPQQAAPIVLIALFIASSIGAIHGLRKGTVRYKAASLMAFFGMLIAPFGVYLAHRISNGVLNIILVLALTLVAYRMWKSSNERMQSYSEKDEPACSINPATSKLFWTASCTKKLVFTGSITGFLSGLLGVGGGFFIVPSLHKVSNFNNQTIVNTTLATIALISISSVATYWHHAEIQWALAIPFVISTTVAMLGFSSLHHKIPSAVSKKGFALLCLVAAFVLIAKVFIAF
jgi:uncharacterized protein